MFGASVGLVRFRGSVRGSDCLSFLIPIVNKSLEFSQFGLATTDRIVEDLFVILFHASVLVPPALMLRITPKSDITKAKASNSLLDRFGFACSLQVL